MASQDNVAAYGGFFVNNFKLLRDLEGTAFQVTKQDILDYIETCFEGAGKCPSNILVKKIEERGYVIHTDGKGMVMGALDYKEKVKEFAYMPFAMSVQKWLFDLFPCRKDGAGVIWREYNSDQAQKIADFFAVTFKVFDGVLFLAESKDHELMWMDRTYPIDHGDDVSYPENYFDEEA